MAEPGFKPRRSGSRVQAPILYGLLLTSNKKYLYANSYHSVMEVWAGPAVGLMNSRALGEDVCMCHGRLSRRGTTGGFQKEEGLETRKVKGLPWEDQETGRYPQGEG